MTNVSVRWRTYAAGCGSLLASLAVTAALASPAGPGGATVSVESGAVAGVVTDGIAAYKGIPYAAPPVGNRRWRAPAPPAKWSGVRQATDYGASCPQAAPPRHVPLGRAGTTGEDCLTLNVWTPVARTTALPVMVWLHGGGNTAGTGSETYFDGTSFARDGVVLVTLNYRLGVLGFFAHPSLTREARGAPTGNFGLLDQIAALRWVRANIAAFGGDPSNVTLFGESAGGVDALTLASSEAAGGLFQRVIAESAGFLWGPWPTLPEAEAQGSTIAKDLGLDGSHASPAQLRALPVEALARVPNEDQPGEMIDGIVLRAQPAVALARGARVPVIVGSDDDDGSVLGDAGDPDALFPRLSAADVALVRARYRALGVKDDTSIAQRMFGAAFFAVPSRWVAARSVANGTKAYLFRFDYVQTLLGSFRSAATHGSEIPFVFESWATRVLSDSDRRVGSAVHDCWVAFAKSGVPQCSGAPGWQPYDPQNRLEMVFDAQPSVRDPGDTDVMDLLERKFWPR